MGDYLSSLTFSLIAWFGFCLCSFQEQRSPWNDCWLPIVSGKISLYLSQLTTHRPTFWKRTHLSRGAKTHTCASAVARETRCNVVFTVTQGHMKKYTQHIAVYLQGLISPLSPTGHRNSLCGIFFIKVSFLSISLLIRHTPLTLCSFACTWTSLQSERQSDRCQKLLR